MAGATEAWMLGILDGHLLNLEKEIAHIRELTKPIRDALEEEE